MSDIDFLRLGLLRCISVVDSGRHFLQTTKEIHGERLPHSTYFKALKSSRRTSMLEAIERQSYNIHCELLASHGIDYLKSFPELGRFQGSCRLKLTIMPPCVSHILFLCLVFPD